jgi:hypothetical protein
VTATAVLGDAEDVLRGTGRHAAGRESVPWMTLLAWIVAAGFLYGATMGSHRLIALQALYSGLKVPFLLLLTSLVCLPNFFVLNTVLGLREDFAAACRGLFASQATIALCLASLAPILIVGYLSTEFYATAKMINGALFAVASIAGQVTLWRHYRPLVERDPRHRLALAGWLCLYVFVAIQLAWLLRPFIGNPTMETTFFRQGAWSNAYVQITRIIFQVLGIE